MNLLKAYKFRGFPAFFLFWFFPFDYNLKEWSKGNPTVEQWAYTASNPAWYPNPKMASNHSSPNSMSNLAMEGCVVETQPCFLGLGEHAGLGEKTWVLLYQRGAGCFTSNHRLFLRFSPPPYSRKKAFTKALFQQI